MNIANQYQLLVEALPRGLTRTLAQRIRAEAIGYEPDTESTTYRFADESYLIIGADNALEAGSTTPPPSRYSAARRF